MADGPWTEYQRPGRKQQPQAAPVKPPASQPDRDPGTFASRSAGLLQGGVLNPLEELGRFIEHATGKQIAPDALRDALKSFRSYARSHPSGQMAEAMGEIGGTMMMPESRLPSVLRGALSGAMQPVENSKDYWFDKALQTGVGALSGGVVGSPTIQRLAAHAALGTAAPHAFWAHWPLHHAVRQAAHALPSGSPALQRGAGALGGAIVGRGIDDQKAPPAEPQEDEQPPLPPAPTPPPPPIASTSPVRPPPAAAAAPQPNFSQRFQGGQ